MSTTSPPSSSPPPSPPPPGSQGDLTAARDLGFGFRVADQSRLRLLNKDGSFNVVRRGMKGGRALAPYHAMLAVGWGSFLAFVCLFYLAVNAVFALCYMACGADALAGPGFANIPSPWNQFLRAFFFSVETFGTIGYGHVFPVNLSANAVLTAESLVGFLSLAVAAGIVFARFSRPVAHILYSHRAVVAPYQEKAAFMFRCANRRPNQLLDVSVRVLYTEMKERPNGERVRSFTVLPLEFAKVTFFTLSWTVVHPIDERSPLMGYSAQVLAEKDAEFLILMSGIDEMSAQTVYSRTSYKAHEIVWGAKFRPMFVESAEAGVFGMDLTQIHDVETAALPL